MLTAVHRRNLSTWANLTGRPKKPVLASRVPKEEYVGRQPSTPNWAKKFRPALKEGARKAGFALTTAAVAGLGAAIGAVPAFGMFSNIYFGIKAGKVLSPFKPEPAARLASAGLVGNLIGSAAASGGHMVGLVIPGIAGGISGGIVGKNLAEKIFGKWSQEKPAE